MSDHLAANDSPPRRIRRFLVIDLSLIFTMNWKATENTANGNAHKTTIAAVAKMAPEWDVVVVACDAHIPSAETGWKTAPSFRMKIDPPRVDPDDANKRLGYKAEREARGAPYYEQYRLTKERLAADGCHVYTAPEICFDIACPECPDGPGRAECPDCGGTWHVPGYNPSGFYAEADDVIGWIVAEYRDAAEASEDPSEWALRIWSSDMDLFQLVDDMLGVEVLSPHAGQLYRADDVIKKIGMPPSKVAHFKALAGDKSDNYHPFRGPMGENGRRNPGIGPEGATKLLAAYGDARTAVSACLKDPPPVTKGGITDGMVALIRRAGGSDVGAEQAVLNGLALATLRINLPGLDFAPVLAGPAQIRRITRDADDAPPGPGDHYGNPFKEGIDRLVSDLDAQGVRMVASSHPMGTPQGPISAAMQAQQETLAGPAHGIGPVRGPRPGAQADAGGQERGNAPRTSASPSPAPGAAKTPGAGAADGPQQDSKGAVPTSGAGPKAPSAVQPHATGPTPSPPATIPGGEGAAEGSGHVLRSDGVVEPARAPATGGEAPKRQETAIVRADGPNERFVLSPYGLEPTSMAQAQWLSRQVCEARMFPKFGTPEAILVVALMGRTRGFGALTSLENAYVVGGQVAWKSAFIVGAVMASGAAEYLTVKETTDKRALAVTKRIRGGIGSEQQLAFTIEEAGKMGYLNPPKEGRQESSWLKQPAVMLRWRAMVSLARMVYPDVAGGMYDKSEIGPDGHMTDEEMGQ